KSPSRAISEIGRVPGGTGARRTPLAVPAITRTGREPTEVPGRLRAKQPLDRAGEPSGELGEEIVMGGQRRVGLDEREGPRARPRDQRGVLGEPGELEGRDPRPPGG